MWTVCARANPGVGDRKVTAALSARVLGGYIEAMKAKEYRGVWAKQREKADKLYGELMGLHGEVRKLADQRGKVERGEHDPGNKQPSLGDLEKAMRGCEAAIKTLAKAQGELAKIEGELPGIPGQLDDINRRGRELVQQRKRKKVPKKAEGKHEEEIRKLAKEKIDLQHREKSLKQRRKEIKEQMPSLEKRKDDAAKKLPGINRQIRERRRALEEFDRKIGEKDKEIEGKRKGIADETRRLVDRPAVLFRDLGSVEIVDPWGRTLWVIKPRLERAK